jgi:hypothetical protein
MNHTTNHQPGYRNLAFWSLVVVAAVLAVFLLFDQAMPREAGAATSRRCQPVSRGIDAGDTIGEAFHRVDYQRLHEGPVGRWVGRDDLPSDPWQTIGYSIGEDRPVYTTTSCAVRSALVCWGETGETIGAWRDALRSERIQHGPIKPCPGEMIRSIATSFTR